MRKNLLLFLILLISLSISSCKQKFEYSTLDQLSYNEILSKDNSYLVIIYQSNCSNCEKIKDVVEQYYHYQKKHDILKIYGCNINKKDNIEMIINMDESYPQDMINTTDYLKVKVKTTPTLLIIKNNQLIDTISENTTTLATTEIKEYLENSMN